MNKINNKISDTDGTLAREILPDNSNIVTPSDRAVDWDYECEKIEKLSFLATTQTHPKHMGGL